MLHSMSDQNYSTQSIWAGEEFSLGEHATQVPIFQSVAYGYPDVDTWLDVAQGRAPGHIYSRNTNPTVHAFEEKIRILENAAAATSFASGMAAISNLLFAVLKPGDRVVSVKDTYGGTSRLFMDFLPRMGIACTLCDTEDYAAIDAEIAKGCALVYLETPTNPTLKVLDIARFAAVGKAVGAIIAVDNTVATPINQSPLELGADVVVHSASKYLGGHADVLGGALCGKTEIVHQVFAFREITGAALDPHAAYLLLRGMKTLALRIRQQNESALTIARFLSMHPQVERVFYPGLDSQVHHDVAHRQMRGYGGMLSFALKGGWDAAKVCLAKLKYAHRAANLGAVETIAGVPATTSHVEVSPAGRAQLGIPEGLIRYSVGIEDTGDLIEDLSGSIN